MTEHIENVFRKICETVKAASIANKREKALLENGEMSLNTKLKRSEKIKKKIENIFLNRKQEDTEDDQSKISGSPVKKNETVLDTVEKNLMQIGKSNKKKDLDLKKENESINDLDNNF